MTDKEQKLIELGYDSSTPTIRSRCEYTKEIKFNNKPYYIYVFVDKHTFEVCDIGISNQQDINDLQDVFNQIQDELRKAGIF